MDCRSYRNALLSGGETERLRRDRHRATCSECRSFTEGFEETRKLLERNSADAMYRRPPAGFSARVMAAIPERPSPLAWASLRLLPLTGALALTLLAWCLLATPSPDQVWAQAGTSDILTWVSSDDG